MRPVRVWLAELCMASVVALSALAAPAAALERASAAGVMLRAGPPGPPSLIQPEPQEAFRARTATFLVTYNGFTPAAQAAFQRAVDLWAQRVSSPVTITVSATFAPLESGLLGSAGSSFIWRNFPGAPRQDTWYADALANKLTGQQLDPTSPDIVARFNSSFPNWHFGGAAAPAGKFDFTTVVLHEIGHGLGFLGGGRVSGSGGSIRLNGSPVIYDLFTENGMGSVLLKAFPDNSTALAAQLQGNNLFFDSTNVRNVTGNGRARLYAPASFQPGSSYSHLDEATYPRGNANSLMTPFLGRGETIRQPGPITLAIFRTLGW